MSPPPEEPTTEPPPVAAAAEEELTAAVLAQARPRAAVDDLGADPSEHWWCGADPRAGETPADDLGEVEEP